MNTRVMIDNKSVGLMKTAAAAGVLTPAAAAAHQLQAGNGLEQQQQAGLLLVSQDVQGKELITVADEQPANGVNVVLDSYCSCSTWFIFCFGGGEGSRALLSEGRFVCLERWTIGILTAGPRGVVDVVLRGILEPEVLMCLKSD